MGRDSVTDSSFLDTRNHTNITSAEQKWSFEFTVTLTTILALVDLCIIVGNCMVLLVIVRHRGMRTRTNLFLVNLAVADLLVGLCVVPFTVTTLMENRWIFGNGAVCMFNGWMNSFCLISSIHTLMYISIHKYFSIVRPLSNPLKLSYIIGMMAAAWLWAAICSTMNVTGLIVEHKPGTSQCGPRYPNDLQMFIIHAIIQITCIVIPFLILVFCYIRMFQEIKRHSQRMRTNSTVAEDLILSQQKKVAVTLLIVLATFVVMALPYFAYANYTTVVKDKKHFSIYLNPVAYTFLFMSSMCNPIIYAFRSPAFREGYKEILCQTPNYVISDDSEQIPRTNRLSSLITTLRRGSSASRRNTLTSLYDVNPEPISPISPLEPGKRRSSRSKQKSLFKLLRSTRQSNAQSVIHRNGDLIIMKSGKIVSVRRGVMEKEGSPFIDRLIKFKAEAGKDKGLSAGLASPGEVMLGIMCDSHGSLDSDKNSANKKDSDTGSEWSDEVFCGSGAHDVKENNFKNLSPKTPNGAISQRGKENGIVKSSTSVTVGSKETPMMNNHSVPPLENNVEKKVVESLSSKRNSLEDVQKSSDEQRNFSLTQQPRPEVSPTSKIPGVVIDISEDNEVLTVMPLTPNTKQYLAKSDFSLDQPRVHSSSKGRLDTGLFKPLSHSRSTENMSKKHPLVMRLPSVEYLDPPVSIFRSRSHAQMGTISESGESRSKSPDREATRSRTPFFQSLSPFSRRKRSPNQNTHM
ncbi:melanopsin-like isoform X1 [Biomphalaria glabrata]|uniref:Melanopsin-like isoform X1 n=1 Tax=Biomphalaria glabrata TaxID=6526 RepID=A0A9W2YL74_BIOGL|nr:melanopsin-like isoform X1 [Biomphalaria glabrata]XP_055863411.1 melanopsin-like isoform X1 [Biomphalaria glabrata]XP_055863419.1 melanopsin-like isoform X1 [Biomphalaria glabrata]XP_055863431.1 melanopsin-like isoform X1 [Biomphalaria glabrata]